MATATTSPIVTAGFTVLSGGQDAGKDASLIGKDQVAAACNMTFRNGLVKTRPTIQNLVLTPADPLTAQNYTGKFQGATFYDASTSGAPGGDGFVLSVAGRLFRIEVGITENTLTEITPNQVVTTNAAFTVPLINTGVSIFLNSSNGIVISQHILINGGEYVVTFVQPGEVFATYIGGSLGSPVPIGTVVQDASGNTLLYYLSSSPTKELIYLFQAENYVVVMRGQDNTVIYDGSKASVAGQNQIPPGLFGLYAWGRIWVTLNDRRTFIGGNLVYDPSGGGNPQINFRDSILFTTNNQFIASGGAFTVPSNSGPITSMFALNQLDTSLGIGPILIGTTNSVVSCNAPVDATTWKNLTYPIQTISLVDYGPQGPRCVNPVNGDAWYRSFNAIRSFIVARRDINVWGNTPMSHEVSELLDDDTTDLLYFASTMQFDNKEYCTFSPYRTEFGIAHRGAVVMNLDSVSDLRQKLPPCWEGAFTGVQILQFVKGSINQRERGFAFVLNNGVIELWEIMPDGTSYYDQYTAIANGQTSIIRAAIQGFIHTRRDNFGDSSLLKQLHTAELFIDEIVDQVSIKILFRPDEYPSWFTWTTLEFCASVSQCSITQGGGNTSCQVWQAGKNQYASRVMLVTPTETCNVLTNQPANWGYEFQFRLEITGHCRIRKFRPKAYIKTDKQVGECPNATPDCRAFPACDTNWFAYDSRSSPVTSVPFTLAGAIPQVDVSQSGTVRNINGVTQVFDPDDQLWHTVTVSNGQLAIDPQGYP